MTPLDSGVGFLGKVHCFGCHLDYFMEKNGKSHHETNQHLGIFWLGTCHVWIVDVWNLFLFQADVFRKISPFSNISCV